MLSYLDTVSVYGLMLSRQLMQAASGEILQQFVVCKFHRDVIALATVQMLPRSGKGAPPHPSLFQARQFRNLGYPRGAVTDDPIDFCQQGVLTSPLRPHAKLGMPTPSSLLARIAGRRFAYRCKVFNSVCPVIIAISKVCNVVHSKNRATASCRRSRILLA